jgi:high-affinity nickel-transport protein
MTVPPNDWLALVMLVFILGLKHGLDADHLAIIDGLTRFNASRHNKIASWCGFLFSFGHGIVVIVLSLTVGMLASRWEVPHWLENLGAWISISFLTLLGFINLRAVLTTPASQVVHIVGIKGRFLARLQQVGNPLFITIIGALFAFSLDTLSQAALYGLAASQFGGGQFAMALGFAFMLGMMATDGINSLWISRLLRRSDQMALIASRIMGMMVGGISLLVAGFGVAKYFSPMINAWNDGKEIYFGISVIAITALSFAAAWYLVRGQVVLVSRRDA